MYHACRKPAGGISSSGQWMYRGCTKDVRGWPGARDRCRYEIRIGSGTGIRTLNLAVNRSLHPVQNWQPEVAE